MLGRHKYLLYSPSNIPKGLGYEIEISVCILNGKRDYNGINKSHKKSVTNQSFQVKLFKLDFEINLFRDNSPKYRGTCTFTFDGCEETHNSHLVAHFCLQKQDEEKHAYFFLLCVWTIIKIYICFYNDASMVRTLSHNLSSRQQGNACPYILHSICLHMAPLEQLIQHYNQVIYILISNR